MKKEKVLTILAVKYQEVILHISFAEIFVNIISSILRNQWKYILYLVKL